MSKLDEFRMFELEKVMNDYRIEALAKISSILIHQRHAEDFALTLAYAYFEEQESSLKIAKSLGLELIDFLAISEDLESFEALYLKELEAKEGEDRFYDSDFEDRFYA